jgi:calcineurin-like phosphoesterase family protein
MWKIELQKGQDLFFTSDTHYNHKNICRGVTDWDDSKKTRDFKSLEKMNSSIVNNINSKVGQDDILIHLGDWSFGGFESIKEFRDRIICKNIYLVLGNHDHHIENNRDNCQSHFIEVSNYSRLQVKTKQGEELNFVLCHFPICSWQDLNKGVIHLFGHVHLPQNLKITRGKAMDVGVDGNDLSPYSLKEITSIMKHQPCCSVSVYEDHHVGSTR